MKIRIIFLLLIFISFVSTIKAQSRDVSIECENLSFNGYCKEVSKQSNISIYYNDVDLDIINISLVIKNTSPLSAVKLAIDTLVYQAVLWNNSIIITKDYIVPTEVVHYSYELLLWYNKSL